MNNSHQRWLLEQLPQWEREGLLTAEAAHTLRSRNAVDASQPGLAQMVMGALGALLVGTGLIAVLGYNWDEFSKPVRLLFAFLPLLLTQLFSLRVLQRGDAFAHWVRESAALLQALAAGACIALVSQIYNLGGEWPDFLFWWFLLSLPLAWVMRSHAVAIFYLIAIAIWSVNQNEVWRPWYESSLLYPLLLLGLAPYWPGWPCKGPLPVTVRWFAILSAGAGLHAAAWLAAKGVTAQSYWNFEVAVWLSALTTAALLLIPLTKAGIAESNGRKPQVVLGTLWILGYGIAGTFQGSSEYILKGASQALTLNWCWVLFAVLVVFTGLAVWTRRWAVLAIASITLLPLLALPLWRPDHEQYRLLSWLFTMHLAVVGTVLIVLDVTGKRGAPRLGALLLSALIIARMADSELSLLAKGLAFIFVGIGFLAFNILVSRKHRSKLLAQP